MTITRCLWILFVTVTSSLDTWRHLKGANFRALYLRNCTSDLVRPWYVGTPGSVIDENGGHVQITSLRHHVTCDVVLKVQHEYVLGISQWLTQNISYTWQNETPLCLYTNTYLFFGGGGVFAILRKTLSFCSDFFFLGFSQFCEKPFLFVLIFFFFFFFLVPKIP